MLLLLLKVVGWVIVFDIVFGVVVVFVFVCWCLLLCDVVDFVLMLLFVLLLMVLGYYLFVLFGWCGVFGVWFDMFGIELVFMW